MSEDGKKLIADMVEQIITRSSVGTTKGWVDPTDPPEKQHVRHTRPGYISNEKGILYRYDTDANVWVETTDTEVRSATIAMEKEGQHHTSSRRRKEIVENLKDDPRILCPGLTWNFVKDTEVAFRNCIYDIDTGETRDHDPEDLLDRTIETNYNPDAQCPTWERVVQEAFSEGPDPAERYQALQEFFGYILLPHAKYRKACFLVGTHGSGKTLMRDVARGLVGESRFTSLVPSKMGSARDRYQLVGKALNGVGDLSAKAVIDDGAFKELVSTQEAVSIDPKYKNPFMYTPTCVHMFCCNSMPGVDDMTHATLDRFLVIEFFRIVPNRDPNLLTKLNAEREGIAQWALKGAIRLVRNKGTFTHIPSADDVLAIHQDDSNPLSVFLAGRYEKSRDSEDRIPMRTLVFQFLEWSHTKYTTREIGRMFTGLGFTRRKAGGINYVVNIRQTDPKGTQWDLLN